MAVSHPQPQLAVRGSEGLSLLTLSVGSGGSVRFSEPSTPLSTAQNCRVLAYSLCGSFLAFCDGQSVQVLDISTNTVKCTIPKPKTRCLQFSPKGTYLALWEPYVAHKNQPGAPNLEVWTTEKVAELIQKKQQEWCPQWTEDEQLCARSVTNEVHCYEGGQPGSTVSNKLRVEGLSSYSLSPGSPCKIAVYVPGSKGAPSFVRMFQYPRLEGPGAILANRSFYRADSVKFSWNKKGSAVLVMTSVDVDKSGASYYGEQGLLFLSARGDGNLVVLDKKGPIYAVEWNPNSEEFCVVYGFMPCKATLFSTRCEPIHDFGTGHRNLAEFNPHGNILCLAGFGNLRGEMEFWDRRSLKLLSKPQASDSTHFQWCPDGVHVVTATTAPRLRVGNGFKLWHFKGSLMFQKDTPPRHELWEVCWRPLPPSAFPTPDVSVSPPPSIAAAGTASGKKAAAYVPPALRGAHRPTDAAGDGQDSAASKSAQRNRKKKQKSRQPETEGKGGRSQEQQDAVSVTAHLMGGASEGVRSDGGGGDDREKKLKNLRKKLRQIEQLKQQQAEGKELELNQLEKIKTEATLLDEIAKLEVTS